MYIVFIAKHVFLYALWAYGPLSGPEGRKQVV